jgi:hypothetical protein
MQGTLSLRAVYTTMTIFAESLRPAKRGLWQYLADNLPGRKKSTAPEAAPSPADKQQIGKLIRWWMKHDPLDASRRIVDAVGLGGAYHLPDRAAKARPRLPSDA